MHPQADMSYMRHPRLPIQRSNRPRIALRTGPGKDQRPPPPAEVREAEGPGVAVSVSFRPEAEWVSAEPGPKNCPKIGQCTTELWREPCNDKRRSRRIVLPELENHKKPGGGTAVLILKIGVPLSRSGFPLIRSAPVRPRQGRDVGWAATPGVLLRVKLWRTGPPSRKASAVA